MKNPFRYRGYVWDAETELYYLGSRYYDAEVGRFLNPDDTETLELQTDTPVGKNLYVYCFNNPPNMKDDVGYWPKWLTKVAIGTAVIAAAAVLTVATAGTGTALACFAVGALKGAAVGAASGAVSGAITGAVEHRVTTGSWNGAATAALNGAADGYMSGAISGFVVGGITSNACFVAGTQVLTEFGNAAIETVKQGDLVWAGNPETGETALKQVVRTFINESCELIHVYAGEEEIVTTPGHPFYVKDKGWVRAGELHIGNALTLRDGGTVAIAQVWKETLSETVTVYNFEVEGFHTYFVGRSAVLVHNACHGNSLQTKKKTDLYVSRDNNTGIAQKVGETTRGVKRYTRTYYATNNVHMQIIATGTKKQMHYQQHRILKTYLGTL